MEKNEHFNILIVELGNTPSNLILEKLNERQYCCYVAYSPTHTYDILRIHMIDLVIINATKTTQFEEEIIKDIQNLTDCGIVFLTADPDAKKIEEFSKYNLLSYQIKFGNLLNVIKDIDILIQKLISNISETVLIVKGKNETRDLAQELLRLRRYNVVITKNGASAWKKLDVLERLSLVIIDINLQDMDSIDVIKKAKKLFSNSLPVISISKKCDPLVLQQNMANGLSDFIKTPISTMEFILKIDLWIDNIKQKREIENQKQEIENALKSFKALANATMEALVMFENNVCIDVNDEALKMFKYAQKSEIIGTNILDFVPESISKNDKNELLKNDTNHRFELNMLRSDESIFPVQIKERNIVLENKNVKIIAILDLSDIKRNEDIIHQQSKMASMGEMMENIAHQWRQPLNAISISASSILVSQDLGISDEEDMKEQLEAIIESTEFLSNTIMDFQNFLKDNKNCIQFTLKDVVMKVLKLIDGNLKKNQITVRFLYEEDIDMVGLENELMQVVLNIINNAKDALVEKHIENSDRVILIQISKSIDLEEGIVEIQDSAGGIPKKIIDKIFEPYFTTKHKSQGTGLGLYMTHQMVIEHMKGKIEVENKKFSQEGKNYLGANFKIIIPFDLRKSDED